MQPGTQLGSYEILSPLGKGGMGEVWRARDRKLGREVAIKTLPEEFAKDEERLARFEREAKLLASLNHPNIGAIYGLEEDNGTRFLVLELVEGDTLADRLKRGAIPVEESLKLALQIAEALEAAHEKGVIHRDLKPANIKVTLDGKVKVLDFGLAKAFDPYGTDMNLSNSLTMSMAATRQGVILGTAAYMSPEQASGTASDKRADIWSFGVVLFEMLTGHETFTGETVSHILAAVLRADPQWNSLPANFHPRLRLLLERCLEKDAVNRYHDIADARVDIQHVLADPDGVIVQSITEAAKPAPHSRFSWFGVTTVLLIVVGVVVWNLKPPSLQPLTRFTIPLSEDSLPGFGAGTGLPAATVSPDGRTLVYVTQNGLYRRDLGQFDAQPIPGTEGGVMPFFSPDGQWLAFRSGGLRKVSVAGGLPEYLVDESDTRGASWHSDDTIVFGRASSGLSQVPADGGEPVPVTIVSDGTGSHRWPDILPSGEAALFTIVTGSPETGSPGTSRIAVVDLETGVHRTFLAGAQPRYVPTGHVVFARETTLWAIPFDADRLEVTGDPLPVVEGVGVVAGTAQFAVSNGTLVYLSGIATSETHSLVWVDRDGNEDPLPFEARPFWQPRLSPDNRRVAVTISDPTDANWIGDIGRGTLTSITPGLTEDSETPLWTPEGTGIVYAGTRSGQRVTLKQLADGSGGEEIVFLGEHSHHHLSDISTDGGILAWTEVGVGSNNPERNSLWTSEVGDGGTTSPFLPNAVGPQSPVFSPDGHWLAYVSYESGGPGIYAESYPEGGNRISISVGPGTEPMWSSDGSEIFYRNREQMVVVAVDTTDPFEVGPPVVLFEGNYVRIPAGAGGRNYDVTVDDRSFLMVKPVDSTSDDGPVPTLQMNIVLNWFEELKERVPVP